jgi:hypothetical protein
VANFTLQPIYPLGKPPRQPSNRRPQNQAGPRDERQSVVLPEIGTNRLNK